jgi:8-oxo-dGTP diphosphatase
MPEIIAQFGIKPKEEYKDRFCAYAVVFNEGGKLLVLKVGATHHLPGGGIDFGEGPKMAIVREAREEAGCEIEDLQYLGKANQFFSVTDIGPLNKLGIFYKARMRHIEPSKRVETDHEVIWLTPEEFINSSAGEFQKWAVKKALE